MPLCLDVDNHLMFIEAFQLWRNVNDQRQRGQGRKGG